MSKEDKAAKKAAAKQEKAVKKAAEEKAKKAKKQAKKKKEPELIFDEDGNVIPQAKTKKEIKAERKAIEKHKKQVKKEAKLHSAKMTKSEHFWLVILIIFASAAIIASAALAVMSYRSIFGDLTLPTGGDETTAASSTTAASGSVETTTAAQSGGETASDQGGDSSADTAAAAENLDPTNKDSVIAYYKAAHKKMLSSAKSVKRTYDNVKNYNEILELGGNSTLASIAKSVMGQFLKENTEETDQDLSVLPSGGDGLTSDMISDFSCTDDGSNYVITLKINASDSSPDDGTKTQNLVNLIKESDITANTPSSISIDGISNEYYGATLKATIDKASGNITQIETDSPTQMKFASVKVAIITVENVGIGLEYIDTYVISY